MILSSCLGGGNTMESSGNPGKLYEVFYIKNGVTQYFVKPLKGKGEDLKYTTDFTLRNDLKLDGDIVCNFSLFSKKPIKKIESAVFKSDGKSIPLHSLEKIFIEKVKKEQYHLRYTSKMTFRDFSQLVKADIISMKLDNLYIGFSNKIVKNLHKIDEYIVELVELNME